MIFRKRKKVEIAVNKSHLKNLMVLALADGHLAEIEEHLLVSIAHRLNLNENDIAEIKSNLDHDFFVLPEKYDDRIEQFNDLLTLMAIDGHIDPEEEVLCREYANKYGLMESVIESMIDSYK
jgi:uncharacterized tellurite resistance protein B-like protein